MILNNMWPMLLDMSRDECKRILRRLELEAYSSIVSALRAQGALSKEKRKLLQDLASVLNISLERHRAEVRRAVNDEKLATIAEHMAGPNTSTEWAIEGRRLIPLMPRLVPQTAFTVLANKMANITATENAKLPPPAQTFRLKGPSEDTIATEPLRHEAAIGLRHPGSPPVPAVLPLKRMEKDDERCVKRKCRSSSAEHVITGVGQAMSPPLPRPKISPHSPSQQVLLQQQQISQPPLQSVVQPQVQAQLQQPHVLPQMQTQPQPLAQPPLPSQPQLQQLVQSSQIPQAPTKVQAQPHPLQLQQQNSQPPPPSQPQTPSPIVQQQQPQLHPQQQQQPQTQQQQQQQLSSVNSEAQKETVQQNAQPTQSSQNSPNPQMSALKMQEVLVSAQSPVLAQQPQGAGHTRVISGGGGNAPVKITFTSTAGRASLCNIGTGTTTTLTTTTPAPTTQKVIIVQSSGATGGPGPPSILQRSLTVPVVKSSPAVAAAAAAAAAAGGGASSASRASLIISGPGGSPPVTPTTIVTISTNPVNSNNVTATTVSICGVPTTAYITSPGGIPHIRPKAVQLPSRMRPRAGSIVIPVTPNPLGSSGSLQGVTLKTTPIQSSRPGMHVKTECSGMKIVPIAAGSAGTTKILPKPSFGASGNQTPMFMMNTTTSSITMVTRTISASCPGSRMVTVNATTLPSSVSTGQSRPIATTLVTKSATGAATSRSTSTGKPNVIVVQKGSGGSFPRGVTVSGGRVQSFPTSLQQINSSMQDVLSKVVSSKSLGGSGGSSGSNNSPVVTTLSVQKAQQQGLHLPPGTQAGNVVVLDLSHENIGKNMVLADILQASGITSEADVDSLVMEKGERQGDQSTSSATSTSVPAVSTDTSHTLQVCKANAAGMQVPRAGGDLVEVTGELDPQTGIYSLHSEPPSINQGSSVTIVPSSGAGNMDIFSTALASADINLDSFQYMEEGLEELSGTAQPSSSIEVTVGEGDTQVQVAEEQLHFLQDTQSGTSEPAAVTVEPSHIDTTGMHIEDYTSQKVQGQEAVE